MKIFTIFLTIRKSLGAFKSAHQEVISSIDSDANLGELVIRIPPETTHLMRNGCSLWIGIKFSLEQPAGGLHFVSWSIVMFDFKFRMNYFSKSVTLVFLGRLKFWWMQELTHFLPSSADAFTTCDNSLSPWNLWVLRRASDWAKLFLLWRGKILVCLSTLGSVRGQHARVRSA